MNEPTNEQKIWILELRHIQPSKTNPRTHFPAEKINELAASIHAEGVRSALWVRPLWCVGWDGVDIETRRPASLFGEEVERLEQPYEIIAGECRYRGALLAERVDVPVQILEVSDNRAYDLQLIENLQRTDLNPIEEANGYRQALALRDIDGQPIHTIDSLAVKVGRKRVTIFERLKLLNAPTIAAEALLAGEISASVASQIGRVPDEALREQLAKRVLAGYSGSPLTSRQTAELIARDYMKNLAAAEFDPTAPALVPDAPACGECPWLMKNNPEFADRPRAGDTCLNPACYQRKTDAAFEKFRELHAAEGKRVLSLEENVQAVENGNLRTWSTNLVPLDDRPSYGVLKPGVTNTKTWRQLVEGRGVEIVVAKGENSQPIEAADLQAAVMAAKENGHAIFPVSNSEDRKASKEKQAKETAAKKRRVEVAKKIGAIVGERAASGQETAIYWLQFVLEMLIGGVMGNYVLDQLKTYCGRETAKAVKGDIGSADDARVFAVAAEIVFVNGLSGGDGTFGPHVKELLKDLEIDAAKMLKEVVAADLKKEKEAAARKAAEEVAKNRPDPFIMPPDAGKRGAKITFDRKTLLFRVKDEPGQLETTFRTAFCLGWNDEREGKKRDRAKVPGWNDLHRLAYGIGILQSKDAQGWPDMKGVEGAIGGVLEAAQEIRETQPNGLSALQDGLKVDVEAAMWLSDALVDRKHDAIQAAEKAAEKKPAPKKERVAAVRTELKGRVLEALLEVGGEGMTVKRLAFRLGVKIQNLHVWFATTGKVTPEIMKVGEATYCHSLKYVKAETPPAEPPASPRVEKEATESEREILEIEAANAIRTAGEAGIAVAALAKKIGYPETDVRRWWATNAARLREQGLACSGGKFRTAEVEVSI